MFLTALSIPVAASQHILQILFFTLKEFPCILEDKKSSKDDFLWYGKRNCLQADLVATQNLSQERDPIFWSKWNYSSSSHLRQEQSEVSKISSTGYSQLPLQQPTQIGGSLTTTPDKARFPWGCSHKT